MKNSQRSLLAAVLLALSPAVAAHGPDDTARQVVGKVSFPTSCDPKVQATFERAVAMLHSYWFPEAEKTFNAVLKDDPQCAMAYWGLATNLLGNMLSAPPPPKDLAAGVEMVAKARAAGAKTQRERDWIEAIAAYYTDHDKVAYDKRVGAYTAAFEKMAKAYPDDIEVLSFYALVLQASAPKSDMTYANQRKSGEILEKIVDQHPDHPGAAHYLIHAYDYPPLAEKGLAAARKYAGIAPAAPHARHMPSHIYSMLGYWEDSIASNRSALEVQPDYIHALDFIVYAQMQLGQDKQALATIAEADKQFAERPPTLLGGYTAKAVMPARHALERGDWKAAAALPVMTSTAPQADSLRRFARGIGMARSGDSAGAQGEVEAIKALGEKLQKAGQGYWASRSDEQVYAIAAWNALAAGDKAEARKLMKAAADGEDASVKHVAAENRLYPMRELYADLLLEAGEPKLALAEYEAAIASYPNRFRSLYGAALAANSSGDRAKAAGYLDRAVAISGKADTPRPELARAREVIARQ
jgi:tetratricopeptide (TPR) repeat protein